MPMARKSCPAARKPRMRIWCATGISPAAALQYPCVNGPRRKCRPTWYATGMALPRMLSPLRKRASPNPVLRSKLTTIWFVIGAAESATPSPSTSPQFLSLPPRGGERAIEVQTGDRWSPVFIWRDPIENARSLLEVINKRQPYFVGIAFARRSRREDVRLAKAGVLDLAVQALPERISDAEVELPPIV